MRFLSRRFAPVVLGTALTTALTLATPVGATPTPASASTPGSTTSAAAPTADVATAPAAVDRRAARRKPRLRVQVVSNRSDLVSGGDAWVRVIRRKGVRARTVRVTLNGRDVSRRFRNRPDGSFSGLVTGMRPGRNRVVARAPRARRGVAVITNHRSGGPVFTGPVVAAYACQETATDRFCNQAPTYSWLYKSSTGSKGLQPYDPANPPGDVATTTTDQGVEVPFIVRQEDGYADRDRYTILTLHRPGQPWKPWRPQRQWNRKLLVTHGGGCGASYSPATPPLVDYSGTLDDVPAIDNSYVTALGKGFAVMSTALSNTGHNCDVSYNAESLMMAKERLVERYGRLRYTIGTGCSGGSVAQHTVANAYPGIYQGLVTTCSYPDVMSAGAQFADYHLMRLYFEDPSRWGPGVAWLPTQMADVEGHLTHVNAITADEGLFKSAINPEHACGGVPDPVPGDPTTRYDSETNPGGVRCSILDLMRNRLGVRPESVWSEQEQEVGRGFAGIPFANAGIQYGLKALQGGRITPAQFVDLNATIGGLDINADLQAARTAGDDTSVANAYRTGLLNEFDNVDQVAMINHGGPDPGIAHDYSHAVWSDLRLQEAQGHTDNRVEWFGPTPLIGDATWANQALLAMDEWLSAVEKDKRRLPLARKIVEDRPATLQDRCVAQGVPGFACEGDLVRTNLSTPRQEAGGPQANDVLKCRRVPLDRSSYTLAGAVPITFTEAEWQRLEETFPDGVCDWSRPGVGQDQEARTWLSYGTASTPVYGGRELRRVPRRSMGGWQGPVFASVPRG